MDTMRKHRRATAGFTLIEMMVVVIIMAVILAYAVPGYKSLVTQYRMSDELNQIAADVALARSEAIKEGMDVTICPSADPTAAVTTTTPACSASSEWNTGWIIFTDSANNQTFGAGDVMLRVHNGFSGTDTLVSTVNGGTTPALNAMTFNRMGGTGSFGTDATQTNQGDLTLNDATNDTSMIRCLVLLESGLIQVHSPQTNSTYPTSSCP
ncbi:prepilin-type N-terminal cleavage/methylation domain-containing protein [Dyella monticola]|uniref:Type II secretion system protein H n=1 Tax=Dyella monticola TaxID=1927958 RepID=A0A370X8K1_9GAMM|nr:GspH/FimT family pseudopilin [Dyella monticola]RDS84749.1 prepilin-type N-terminal cleavage/methylation domain-containing protein [Dyella monticola]